MLSFSLNKLLPTLISFITHELAQRCPSSFSVNRLPLIFTSRFGKLKQIYEGEGDPVPARDFSKMPPKRQQPPQTTHVSSSIRVIPRLKKPRSPASDDLQTTIQTKPFHKAWQKVCSSISQALNQLRAPALAAISQALSTPPPHHTIPAICVTLGAAAAAGDRTHAFDAIFQHITGSFEANVLRLQSAHHSSMSAITALFDTAVDSRKLIVALDDADLFPEDVLRDLVYLCCKRGQSSGALADVAMVLGFGADTEALHTALGVQEATMVAVTCVQMPHAHACFEAIVRHVFSPRKLPLMLSEDVYALIEDEFFGRECTVAMVLRVLKLAYAAKFEESSLLKETLNDEGTVGELDAEALRFLGEEVRSVSMELVKGEKEWCEDELRRMVAVWHANVTRWRNRCALVETVVCAVLVHLEVNELAWMRERCAHTNLRLQLFRAFLVSSGNNMHVDTKNIEKLIVNVVHKQVSRQYLIKIVDLFRENIESSWSGEEDEDVTDLLERFRELKETLKSLGNESTGGDNDDGMEKLGRTRQRCAQGAKAALQRRRQLLADSASRQKVNSSLSAPREKLVSIVKDFLDLVGPFRQLPLHELYVLSNVSDVTRLLGGVGGAAEPRGSFFTAMRNPQNVCPGITEAILPDTAIAYRLLAEGGRLKNIYDWYNTFCSIRTANAVERDEHGNIRGLVEIPQAELQARFARACSELEFLGLMKYTNRKTDHVMRLIFE